MIRTPEQDEAIRVERRRSFAAAIELFDADPFDPTVSREHERYVEHGWKPGDHR